MSSENLNVHRESDCNQNYIGMYFTKSRQIVEVRTFSWKLLASAVFQIHISELEKKSTTRFEEVTKIKHVIEAWRNQIWRTQENWQKIPFLFCCTSVVLFGIEVKRSYYMPLNATLWASHWRWKYLTLDIEWDEQQQNLPHNGLKSFLN